MLYFSLFLAGFTLGIFTSLKVFSPDKTEDIWDPQHFPAKIREKSISIINYKDNTVKVKKSIQLGEKPRIHIGRL